MELNIAQKRALAVAAARQRVQQQSAPAPDAAPAAPSPGFDVSKFIPNVSSPAFGVNAAESVPIVGPYLKGGMDNVTAGIQSLIQGKPFDQMKQQVEQSDQTWSQLDPASAVGGKVFGNVAPFVVGGAIPGVAKVLGMEGGLATKTLFGAGSGAAINGADTLARGGTAKEAGVNALIGGAAGGLLPSIAAGAGKAFSAATGKTISDTLPAIADLEAAKQAAYRAVDNSGAKYSAPAYDGLVTDIFQRVSKLNPTRHKIAFKMLAQLQSHQGPISLTQLDEMRQVIYRDVAGLTDPKYRGDAHFGQEMIGAIDDFIESAKPGQMVGGNPEYANKAILSARQANTTFRKSEALQNLIEETQRRVAATGSGGNIDNALRQAMNGLLKGKVAWTPEERKAIGNVVLGGGKLQDVLRLIGKLSPSGNGLMAMLGLGATMMNPANALAPAAGIVAKTISDGATKAAVGRLQSLVRTGAVPPKLPAPPLALPGGAFPMLATRPLTPIPVSR